MGIPIQIFQFYGGQIPYNLNASQYNALVNLSTLCQFNDAQFQWVTGHTSLIPLMSNLLAQHNNDPAWIAALKAVIDARIGGTHLFPWANMAKLIEMQVSLGLTEGQLRWVVENSKTDMGEKAVEILHSFLLAQNFDQQAVNVAKFTMDLQIQNELPINFQSAGFQQIASQYPEIVQSQGIPDPVLIWTICYEVEKAKLKFHNPSKYTGSLGNFKLCKDAAWNVSIEAVHIALDGIGLVPVVGEVADLFNATLYVMEGDWANGTLAVASAVPFVGWYSTGAKYASKVINTAGNYCKLNWIDNVGTILFGSRDQLARVIKPPSGYHAHHLIPWEISNNPVVQQAAKAEGKSPWHMNDVPNGAVLSTTQHLGSHPEYTNAIRNRLQEIEAHYGANLTPELAKDKCIYLANQAKLIISQNPTLKVNDPIIVNQILQIQVF